MKADKLTVQQIEVFLTTENGERLKVSLTKQDERVIFSAMANFFVDGIPVDETPVPPDVMNEASNALNLAQAELVSCYKRLGITGSNVLDEVNRVYKSITPTP